MFLVRVAEILVMVALQGTPVQAQQPPIDRVSLERASFPPISMSVTPSWTVTWINDSTLSFADFDEASIVFVNIRTGGAVHRFGRKGTGPGEFQGIAPPLVGPDRQLLIMDQVLRRLTILDSTFNLKPGALYGVPMTILLGWNNNGVLGIWQDPARHMAPTLGLLNLGNSRATTTPFLALDSLFAVTQNFPPLFIGAALGKAGSVYVGVPGLYKILRLDATRRITGAFSRADIRPTKVTQEEIDQRIAAASKVVPLPPSARSQLREAAGKINRPFFVPSGLSEDPIGRLWVVTTRWSPQGTEVDIFSPSGSYLRTIRLRDRVLSLSWQGYLLAAVVNRLSGESESAIDFYRLR